MSFLEKNPNYKNITLEKWLKNKVKNLGIRQNTDDFIQMIEAWSNDKLSIHFTTSSEVTLGTEINSNFRKTQKVSDEIFNLALLCISDHINQVKPAKNQTIENLTMR